MHSKLFFILFCFLMSLMVPRYRSLFRNIFCQLFRSRRNISIMITSCYGTLSTTSGTNLISFRTNSLLSTPISDYFPGIGDPFSAAMAFVLNKLWFMHSSINWLIGRVNAIISSSKRFQFCVGHLFLQLLDFNIIQLHLLILLLKPQMQDFHLSRQPLHLALQFLHGTLIFAFRNILVLLHIFRLLPRFFKPGLDVLRTLMDFNFSLFSIFNQFSLFLALFFETDYSLVLVFDYRVLLTVLVF